MSISISCILNGLRRDHKSDSSDSIGGSYEAAAPGNVEATEHIQARTSLDPVIFCDNLEENEIARHLKSDDGRPFLVGDASDIVRKFHLWRSELPKVELFFAVKSNPHPAVLRILATLGASFDCASQSEIKSVLNLGVGPDSVVFANTCKIPAHLRYAAKMGVRLLTFDGEPELHKIHQIHPNAQLLIRIRADETGCDRCMGVKFGCNLEEVPHLLRAAKNLRLQVIGVSFHVGVNYDNPIVFSTTIEWCKRVFQIGEDIGHKMTLLDIGGGFPGTNEMASNFSEICRFTRDALDEHFPPKSGVRVIAEPGAFLVEDAFTLYTQVIAKRPIGDQMTYFLNDGIYGSFRLPVKQGYTYVPVCLKKTVGPLHPSILFGPTMDSFDVVRSSCLLPDLEVGDWVLFRDMGAYACTVACTFNGLPKPSIVFAISSRLRSRFEECSTWPELCQVLKEQISEKSEQSILDSSIRFAENINLN